MKAFFNKKTIKNLIFIFAIASFLTGFFINPVKATTDTDGGGNILKGIEKFVVYLCDNAMQWLQEKFVSNDKISQGNGTYNFQYSPAIIFSGTVPALDINFITPGEGIAKTTKQYITLVDALEMNGGTKLENTNEDISKIESKYNINNAEKIDISKLEGSTSSTYSEEVKVDLGDDFADRTITHELKKAWKNEDGIYVIVLCSKTTQNTITNTGTSSGSGYGAAQQDPNYSNSNTAGVKTSEYIIYKIGSEDKLNEATKITNTTVEKKSEDGEMLYTSTARVLQDTIATWYNALRKIALIGLLSVLVYVGIRIVLTSSSSDKAKYKNMLKDWVVAICILFTLHYIMSITITVVNEISAMFSQGETDELLNTLRADIYTGVKTGDKSWGSVLAEVIMYAALVINTLVFTIQYLMRVIYMAFYTLIAPLITLTYPLDKIKDGQAQAFNMWIREYIFTALTQVIHLVIYYVLVSSAMDLVVDYPLYAIVVLMFIKKAEDIIKKMFGFDKAETVGTLGAAVTGGLVMNTFSKIGTMAGKGNKGGGSPAGKEGEAKGNKVRTAGNNPLSALQGNQGTSGEKEKTPKEKVLAGAKSIAGTYGKKAGQTAVRYGGALTGAMLGVAGGIAQGDIGAALTGGAAGFGAGKSIGDRISRGVDTKGVRNAIDGVKDTWNKGVHGAEFAESASNAREFKRSSDYKALKDKFGDDLTDEGLRAMLSADIKDKKTMTKILESGDVGKGIGYYTLAKECPESIYYNPNLLRTYVTDVVEREGLDQSDADEIIKNMKKYR